MNNEVVRPLKRGHFFNTLKDYKKLSFCVLLPYGRNTRKISLK